MVFVLLAALVTAGSWWAQRRLPYGIDQRVACTTSKVVGAPEPPDPFLLQRVFPNLKFGRPLDIAFGPDAKRVFVIQHSDSRILSFPNDPSASQADTALDVDKLPFRKDYPKSSGVTTYGIAFHPKFQSNHFCYVSYCIGFPYKLAIAYAATYPENSTASRVSRFTMSDTDPPTIDPDSEKILITWPGSGHNGSCLRFGRDGFLYISTGDNGDPNPPDPHDIGQNIGDLRSKVLRIDVDHSSDTMAYAIPGDNPVCSNSRARGEVFAYGLRNPWKFSFDSQTGDLWAGDVGWELWESVYRIVPGGNYGWSIMEGPQPVYPNEKRRADADHPAGSVATSAYRGGVDHRRVTFIMGQNFRRCSNQYMFGDWETRRIWAAPVGRKNAGKYKTIAQTDQRVVAFGEDPQGELYIVDYEGGGIYRLGRNPAVGSERTFPRKLSDTGLFDNVAEQKARAGRCGDLISSRRNGSMDQLPSDLSPSQLSSMLGRQSTTSVFSRRIRFWCARFPWR